MTIKLEHQFPEEWDTARRNFEKLAALVVDTGGQSVGIRFGLIGAINAATLKTITHGLGKTPVVVFTQAANGGVALGVDLVGATTFRVANTSATNTSGYWAVIG